MVNCVLSCAIIADRRASTFTMMMAKNVTRENSTSATISNHGESVAFTMVLFSRNGNCHLSFGYIRRRFIVASGPASITTTQATYNAIACNIAMSKKQFYINSSAENGGSCNVTIIAPIFLRFLNKSTALQLPNLKAGERTETLRYYPKLAFTCDMRNKINYYIRHVVKTAPLSNHFVGFKKCYG